MRNVRFSRDKSPFMSAFRAHIGPMGKQPVPVGYYILLRPGDRSFLGGGLLANMFRVAAEMVRDQIASHGREGSRIISAPAFCRQSTVRGMR